MIPIRSNNVIIIIIISVVSSIAISTWSNNSNHIAHEHPNTKERLAA